MAACTMRGSRVEFTWLKAVEEKFVPVDAPLLQQIGLVWLKVLKDSNRNCPVNRSVNLMFLNSDRSVRQKPGARIAPGRSVGSVVCPAGAGCNAAALNQFVKLCCAPELGSPIWFTRQPIGVAPKQAEPTASKQLVPVPELHPLFPMIAVSGSPDWKV